MDCGLSEINNVIEDLEEMQKVISDDGTKLDIAKCLEMFQHLPTTIEQAKNAREYMKEMQQVECQCERDQMREIGMSQKDFI